MRRTAGSKSATRRGVKALATSRRSRVWSGGSRLSRCAAIPERCSPGMPVRPGVQPGKDAAAFFDSRGSASTDLTSSCRVTR